ncbi:MAG: hypothetical protein MH252_17435 [Thermosynechococcaceae cyanobacterium MS004]|nr:hypothetical protein [Thermosynechococcaceae cyanobacterium MS004]
MNYSDRPSDRAQNLQKTSQAFHTAFSRPSPILLGSLISSPSRFRLGTAWRSLVSILLDELAEDQQVEYLERCWVHSPSKEESQSRLKLRLKQLWTLIK